MNFSEIVQLSVQQRIVLVDAIWESITADRKKEPLSEERIEEAQQRIIAAHSPSRSALAEQGKKPAYLTNWEKINASSRQKKTNKNP